MIWESHKNGYKSYLMLERGLSPHSVTAYMDDVSKLQSWTQMISEHANATTLSYKDLVTFIEWLSDMGMSAQSQARIISGVKSFYHYLVIEGIMASSPADLLATPKLRRKIPDVLSAEEIDRILAAIDLSHPQGQRNRAIIETLYACGLRVSELIGLRLSNYYPDLGLVKVIGKNDKERIVPIGQTAIKYNGIYIDSIRRLMNNIDPKHQDILYLNRRGRQLTRVMIYNIVRQAAADAGIQKKVSPHTFRHSFATHLIEGGADLKAVQDMLGHESITTTEIYTHLDTQYLREAIMRYHPRSRTS